MAEDEKRLLDTTDNSNNISTIQKRFNKEGDNVVVRVGNTDGNAGDVNVWFGVDNPLNTFISPLTSRKDTDLYACMHALQAAYRNDIPKLKIKTDSEFVITLLNGDTNQEDFVMLISACNRLDSVTWDYEDYNESPCNFIKDDDYVVVYTAGLVCKEKGKGGIGIWFGKNHPLNTSQSAVEGAPDLQAWVLAIQMAHRNGIRKLQIRTNSDFLESEKVWDQKRKDNVWSTMEGNHIKTLKDKEILSDACELLDRVVWEHINDNKRAIALARKGAQL